MQHPFDVLTTVIRHTAAIREDGSLHAKQQTFIQHIHRMAQQLQSQVAAIPHSDLALQQIIPTLDDHYDQQLVAIYGYARMLLNHPEAFDTEAAPAHYRSALQAIDELAVGLAQQSNALRQAAFEQRKIQRHATPQPLDLQQVIDAYAPIWYYFLRDTAVTLNIQTQAIPIITVNAYHLVEFLRHVLVTLAHDLMSTGRLTLALLPSANSVDLHVVCHDFHLTDAHLRQLFIDDGRHIYPQRLREQGGHLHIDHTRDGSSLIRVRFSEIGQIY